MRLVILLHIRKENYRKLRNKQDEECLSTFSVYVCVSTVEQSIDWQAHWRIIYLVNVPLFAFAV